jgi:hypothetical protein
MPRGWQRMLSGRRLEILDPSPLDVELDDIAHGIARVARWNGQTKGSHPFSVGPAIRSIETRLQAAIHIAFALPAELPGPQLRLIKRADRTAAWLEATGLAGFTEREARATFGAPERLVRSVQPLLDPWPADRAEAEFRSRVRACHPG